MVDHQIDELDLICSWRLAEKETIKRALCCLRDLTRASGRPLAAANQMFESISIARDGFVGGPVDFGQLAESLIFYEQVHFLADHETFVSLVRTWGSDVVLELCKMGTLKSKGQNQNFRRLASSAASPSACTGSTTWAKCNRRCNTEW